MCNKSLKRGRFNAVGDMPDDGLIEKMRARVAQCRQLAAFVTDEIAQRTLTQMADEGEADLHKLEADRGMQDNERRQA